MDVTDKTKAKGVNVGGRSGKLLTPSPLSLLPSRMISSPLSTMVTAVARDGKYQTEGEGKVPKATREERDDTGAVVRR
jgi:hypothetical protein